MTAENIVYHLSFDYFIPETSGIHLTHPAGLNGNRVGQTVYDTWIPEPVRDEIEERFGDDSVYCSQAMLFASKKPPGTHARNKRVRQVFAGITDRSV